MQDIEGVQIVTTEPPPSVTNSKPTTHSTSELLSLLEKATGAPTEEDVRR